MAIIPTEDEINPEIDKHPQIGARRFDLTKPERIFSNFLRSNNIDYLLLRPEFEKYIKASGEGSKTLY